MTCRRGGGDLLPGGLAELGYLFLPRARGSGYAVEACGAVLDRFADASPGERVVLRTQVANSPSPRLARKPGFTEVARFEEFGAEQWFGAWARSHRPSDALAHLFRAGRKEMVRCYTTIIECAGTASAYSGIRGRTRIRTHPVRLGLRPPNHS